MFLRFAFCSCIVAKEKCILCEFPVRSQTEVFRACKGRAAIRNIRNFHESCWTTILSIKMNINGQTSQLKSVFRRCNLCLKKEILMQVHLLPVAFVGTVKVTHNTFSGGSVITMDRFQCHYSFLSASATGFLKRVLCF